MPRVPVIVALLLVVAGCGGDGGTTPPPPPIGVSVTAAASTVGAGDTVALTAILSNAPATAQGITWSSTGGTILGTGLVVQWAAPIGGGSYIITATSAADPSRSASAAVTVTPVRVTVATSKSALLRGERATLTATITGTASTGVTWTANCGTLTGTGPTVDYVAPDSTGTCTVIATSTRDPAQSGTAALLVRPVWRVAVLDDTDDGRCTIAHCTLREAIAAANAAPSRDSIIIESGNAPASIAVTTSLPFITAPVDIVAPGPALLAIDGGTSTTTLRSLLYFDGAFTASVRGLTVRGGRRNGGGGLVLDDSTHVTLRDVHLRNNVSVDAPGGGLLALRGGRGTLVNVEIADNVATGVNGLGGGIAVQAGSLVSMSGGRLIGNESSVSNGGGARVFNGALSLDSVTVTGNRAPAANAGGLGGAVFSDGAQAVVQLVNSTVAENTAGVAGGGLSLRGGTTATITGTTVRANQAPLGGGFEIGNSPVSLVNSHVVANTVTSRGGGVFVFGTTRYTQNGGSISQNVADNSGGGGLYAQENAELILTDVAITENRVGATGAGGLWSSGNVQLTMTGGRISRNESGSSAGGMLFGGGRPSTLTRVAIDSNRAVLGGAGAFVNNNAVLVITDGHIRGNVLTGGGGGGILTQNATLTMIGTTIAGNRAIASGGGVLAFTGGTYLFRNLVVEDNNATNGGGLGFTGTLTVTVEGGTVRRNSASAVGGGVWKAEQSTLTMTGTAVVDNSAGNQGGGIQLVGPGAPATLRQLTVRGNRANGASGGGLTAGVTTLVENSVFANNSTSAIGGGIFAASSGNTTVRNSTFSANSAAMGGGIAATGPISITNATFVANTATDYGGGVGTNNAGAMTLRNVLLAGNLVGATAGNCGRGGTSTLTSGGGNLSNDASCPAFALGSDKPNTPAGVSATLADNGGPTLTHALETGSAAIDAGVAAACPTTDQRGSTRVGTCDIGAVEFGSTPSVGLKRSTTSVPAATRRP